MFEHGDGVGQSCVEGFFQTPDLKPPEPEQCILLLLFNRRGPNDSELSHLLGQTTGRLLFESGSRSLFVSQGYFFGSKHDSIQPTYIEKEFIQEVICLEAYHVPVFSVHSQRFI